MIIRKWILARQNPALPPRAATQEKAISLMAVSGWAEAVAATFDRQALARAVINEASEIPWSDRGVSIVGSGRRKANDRGGHFRIALGAIRKWLLLTGFQPSPRDEADNAYLWEWAYPATARAARAWTTVHMQAVLGELVSESEVEEATALSLAAIESEWEIGTEE